MPGAHIASGERVTLRTLEREDIPFLQRSFANPELRYPLGNGAHKNQDGVEERYEDENQSRFLVRLEGGSGNHDGPPEEGGNADALGPTDEAAAGRSIGVVTLTAASWHRPELAYWLVPDVHGEGYGTEAVSLVVDYVFRVHDTPSVGAGVYDFNDASHRLLESLGFTEEGRLREYLFIDGKYRDLVQYGLLRREWREGDEL